MRNDVFNVIFATCGTFFNRLLSREAQAQRVYQKVLFMQSNLIDGNAEALMLIREPQDEG